MNGLDLTVRGECSGGKYNTVICWSLDSVEILVKVLDSRGASVTTSSGGFLVFTIFGLRNISPDSYNKFDFGVQEILKIVNLSSVIIK